MITCIFLYLITLVTSSSQQQQQHTTYSYKHVQDTYMHYIKHGSDWSIEVVLCFCFFIIFLFFFSCLFVCVVDLFWRIEIQLIDVFFLLERNGFGVCSTEDWNENLRLKMLSWFLSLSSPIFTPLALFFYWLTQMTYCIVTRKNILCRSKWLYISPTEFNSSESPLSCDACCLLSTTSSFY